MKHSCNLFARSDDQKPFQQASAIGTYHWLPNSVSKLGFNENSHDDLIYIGRKVLSKIRLAVVNNISI